MADDLKQRLGVPMAGQAFATFEDWVARAKYALTQHPEYFNAEHAESKGWHGYHFTALCFDQLGRRCRNGADFMRARDEDAFPVWYVWPDQIPQMVADLAAEVAHADRLAEAARERDGGAHDEDCKINRPGVGVCNCGHDALTAALADHSARRGA